MTTGAEPIPAWLAAWRERQPAQAPRAVTHAEPAPTPAAAPTPPPAPAAAAQPRRQAGPAGFSNPVPWPFDGGRRREPVLDHDHHPPRLVRRVGWHRCMRCRRPFWSEDVVALRLCGELDGCRHNDDRFTKGPL